MRFKALVGAATAAFVLATAQPVAAVDHEHDVFERILRPVGCLVVALEGDPTQVLANYKNCLNGQ